MERVVNTPAKLLFLSAVLLASCGQKTSTPVRIAVQTPSTNNYATHFASWLGFYKEEGLDVTISQIAGALAKVKSLRGVQFKKISDPAKFRVGLIAQEVLQIVPEAVCESAEEPHYLSVNYGSLIGVLVEAVKELSEKVAALEALNGAP